MGVCVDNQSGNSVTVNTVYNTVNVIPDQNSTIVEIITPGPQGPQGPPGDPSAFTGSFVTTSSFFAFTSSYNTGSFTGSFIGDGSGLFGIISTSYAVNSDTSSFQTNIEFAATYIPVFNTNYSISSSNMRQIDNYSLEITGSLEVSNYILIKNGFTVQDGANNDVLVVSESIVRIVPNNFDPTGITDAGSIWFTSTSMYVGLE